MEIKTTYGIRGRVNADKLIEQIKNYIKVKPNNEKRID